jgi:hypothetical protein
VTWPVYTETFLRTNVSGAWVAWTVPVGKRAIVRDIRAMNGGTTQGHVDYRLAGVVFARLVTPATASASERDVQLVAYGGEQLSVFLELASQTAYVSGYLFDDPTSALGPPPGVQTLPGDTDPPPVWPS